MVHPPLPLPQGPVPSSCAQRAVSQRTRTPMLWRPSGVCAVVLMSRVLRGARGHVPCHAWQCSPCHRGGRPVGCKDQVQGTGQGPRSLLNLVWHALRIGLYAPVRGTRGPVPAHASPPPLPPPPSSCQLRFSAMFVCVHLPLLETDVSSRLHQSRKPSSTCRPCLSRKLSFPTPVCATAGGHDTRHWCCTVPDCHA